jgi:hypothetical protein
MRRDYLIAIVLAIAAFPAGAALMVAPEDLHLSGRAVPVTFWGGTALFGTLILVAAIIALRAEREPTPKMTVADIGYNAALAGTIVAFAMAILKPSRIAVIACTIALTGVGLDYWFGPPRGFIWAKGSPLGVRLGLEGEPLGWSRLFINNTVFSVSKQDNISNLTIMGGNVGDQEIKLEDAYFLSGIDGTRLDAKIGWGGDEYKIQEIKPIPAGAMLFIMSDPIGPANGGLSQDDFLKKWTIIIFVAKYNGTTQRIRFNQDAVKSMLPKPMEPFPHISPLKGR